MQNDKPAPTYRWRSKNDPNPPDPLLKAHAIRYAALAVMGGMVLGFTSCFPAAQILSMAMSVSQVTASLAGPLILPILFGLAIGWHFQKEHLVYAPLVIKLGAVLALALLAAAPVSVFVLFMITTQTPPP